MVEAGNGRLDSSSPITVPAARTDTDIDIVAITTSKLCFDLQDHNFLVRYFGLLCVIIAN